MIHASVTRLFQVVKSPLNPHHKLKGHDELSWMCCESLPTGGGAIQLRGFVRDEHMSGTLLDCFGNAPIPTFPEHFLGSQIVVPLKPMQIIVPAPHTQKHKKRVIYW